MSRQKATLFGNGKRHRIPLVEGLRLRYLLCIGNKRYKILKSYVKDCLWGERDNPPRAKKINLSRLSVGAGQRIDKRNSVSCYEPTKIWSTRESQFWQWRRVKEWFMEFKDLYSIT